MKDESGPKEPKQSGPRARRRAVAVSAQTLVTTTTLQPDQPLPALVCPTVDGVSLAAWAEQNRDEVNKLLLEAGGILFRGFEVASPVDFENFVNVTCGDLLDYVYRSTVRDHESGHIYNSTRHPAHLALALHNELAHTRNWPMRIAFFCVQAATEGGATPIADSRVILERIPDRIKQPFIEKNVIYQRNYGQSLDLPWQEAFQTTDPAEAEAYCRANGLQFEWTGVDSLQTLQVCQVVATHPVTADDVWFNAVHLHHFSAFPREVRETLLAGVAEEDMPRNAYYGDGSPIKTEVMDEIREILSSVEISFPWQQGDVLLLDNMLVAHGRRPFSGPRKILVGMAQAWQTTAAGTVG